MKGKTPCTEDHWTIVMNKFVFLCCIALLSTFGASPLLAQVPSNMKARTTLDPQFKPFYHGVASGDPEADRVMLWTRVTPDAPGPQTVNWTIALDTGLTNVVSQGTVTAVDTSDYTVKVDVSGLQPATWYYYRFEQNGRYSLVGRTRTTPTGNGVDSLRFAVVSCSNYSDGYFNAYGAISLRNDIHAVLHLGDYIYENDYGSGPTNDRQHEPQSETLILNDYRQRHSQYKLDEDLRRVHQLYPFVTVWDDHETANNSWNNGAENHNSGEGIWSERKAWGIQAYTEWLPIRKPDPQNPERIYRALSYGDLLDLIMLDTRLIGRDEQDLLASGDSARYLLGPQQLSWLSQEMSNSNSQWKVLGQQVMMAPLEIPFVGPLNPDQWDGYQAERERVYDSILTKDIYNVVVLTGDIHSAWANDLPGSGYDANTGANSVGVEFVTTSITTTNSVVSIGTGVIQAANPHLKFINLAEHGYYILDLNKSRTQADYYFVNDIEAKNDYSESLASSWLCQDSARHLEQASAAAPAPSTVHAILPPAKPANPAVSVTEALGRRPVLIGTYPNPFIEQALVKFYLYERADVHIELFDLQGKRVWDKDLPWLSRGLQFASIEGGDLSAGTYLLKLRAGDKEVSRKVLKY